MSCSAEILTDCSKDLSEYFEDDVEVMGIPTDDLNAKKKDEIRQVLSNSNASSGKSSFLISQLTEQTQRIQHLEFDLHNSKEHIQRLEKTIAEVNEKHQDKQSVIANEMKELTQKIKDSEQARQLAVYKLSEMEVNVADLSADKIMLMEKLNVVEKARLDAEKLYESTVLGKIGSGDGFVEKTISEIKAKWTEKYQKEIELVEKRHTIRLEQMKEKNKIAMDLALRKCYMDYSSTIEELKLEHAVQIAQIKHDQMVQNKEIESATNEDRFSIRLEMQQVVQKLQIKERLTMLQREAIDNSKSLWKEKINSVNQIQESNEQMIVRMEVEMLLFRQKQALSRLSLLIKLRMKSYRKKVFQRWSRICTRNYFIRKIKNRDIECQDNFSCVDIPNVDQEEFEVISRKKQALNKIFNLYTIFWIHQKLRTSLSQWKLFTKLDEVNTYKIEAISCFNRVLGAEKLASSLLRVLVRQKTVHFCRWKYYGSTDKCNVTKLQDEVSKLHDELRKVKAQSWKHKRQLLQQFS